MAMGPTTPAEVPRPAYLGVDAYLESLVGARALASALELGLIDRLEGGDAESSALALACGLGQSAQDLLIGLLSASRVLRQDGSRVGLAPGFREALNYRDLIEGKLELAAALLPDLAEGFTRLLADPMGFMATARVFDLFRYDLSPDPTPAQLGRARRWMRLTTVLTRYEAPVLLNAHPFGAHRRVLDVGGNSGELLRHACARHADLVGTVFDIPVVCRVGAEYLAGAPESRRIAFCPGDARRDPLPGGHDLVVFKSILHDWPQPEAEAFLAAAVRALTPGGTLLIFERGPWSPDYGLPGYGQIPVLLFATFYRSPMVYARALEALGMQGLDVQEVRLDFPFFLVVAHRPP